MSKPSKAYFDVLGLPVNATWDQVKAARKTLTLKYHPDKNKSAEATIKTQKINEAYQILEKWFKDNESSKQQQRNKENEQQDPPLKETLFVTLEEVFSGCRKKKKIYRKDASGKTEEKVFDVVVPRGCTDGTKVKFFKEGNKNTGRVPADVEIIIKTESHPHFTRDGDHLYHSVNIEYSEKFTRRQVTIPTIDGNDTTIDVQFEMKEKRLEGKGLPYLKNPYARGHLIIQFTYTQVRKPEPEKRKYDPLLGQDPPLKFDLFVTLEQIFTGVIKKYEIKRKVTNEYGMSRQELRVFDVEVKPGCKNRSTVVFKCEGDQNPGKNPADVIFTIIQKRHNQFKRQGVDIYYTLTITEKFDALFKFRVPTLLGTMQTIEVQFGETEKCIKNFGFPHEKDSKRNGNQIVKIEYRIKEQDPAVEYPLRLTLYDINNGCTKTERIFRKVTQTRSEWKTFTINIKPGCLAGTKVTFPKEGDRGNPDRIPADIVFVIEDERQLDFTRDGSNIHTAFEVKYETPFITRTIEVPTLTGPCVEAKISFGDKETTVINHGLPFPNDAKRRGNLIVKLSYFQKIRDPAIEYTVNVTLKEIYSGCTKTRSIMRKTESGTTEHKEFEVTVTPGALSGTKITFREEGDRSSDPRRIPADIVFFVEEVPHPKFTRNGNNLLHTIDIDNKTPFYSRTIGIPTIKGSKINHKLQYGEKAIEFDNLGLPFPNAPAKYGKLIVTFNYSQEIVQDLPVEYPVYVTLREIHFGCTKIETKKRNCEFGWETRTFTVEIPRGCESGRKIHFPKEGDRHLGRIPGDVVFVVQDAPDTDFTRDGSDVRCKMIIKYSDNFTIRTTDVFNHLNHRHTFDLFFHTKEERFPGLGLPRLNNHGHGDLIVQFEYQRIEPKYQKYEREPCPIRPSWDESPRVEESSGCNWSAVIFALLVGGGYLLYKFNRSNAIEARVVEPVLKETIETGAKTFEPTIKDLLLRGSKESYISWLEKNFSPHY